MALETSLRVKQLVSELHQHNHIDDMTNRWLCQTPNPPCIPVFYTLTKTHKPTPVGRPIISGCDGPTERQTRQTAATHSTKAKVISKGHDRLYQFHSKKESTKKPYSCFNGRYELIHKYTSRGGDRNSMQSI